MSKDFRGAEQCRQRIALQGVIMAYSNPIEAFQYLV